MSIVFVVTVALMFIVAACTSAYSFLMTRAAGDPLGELESYKNQKLAANMSKVHMFIAVFMALLAVLFLVQFPALIEYKQVHQSDYTYELREDETVFATDFDTLATDKVKWANLAETPEKYCVYRLTAYNLLGQWPTDPRLSLGTPPCEDVGKYEF